MAEGAGGLSRGVSVYDLSKVNPLTEYLRKRNTTPAVESVGRSGSANTLPLGTPPQATAPRGRTDLIHTQPPNYRGRSRSRERQTAWKGIPIGLPRGLGGAYGTGGRRTRRRRLTRRKNTRR